MTNAFDGQQEGEHVLFEITPHPLVFKFAFVRICLTSATFTTIAFIIGWQSSFSGVFFLVVLLLVLLFFIGAIRWMNALYNDTKTFITDRRIMRFERVSPFVVAKRALFWSEVLKAKAYEPNLLLKSYNIGTLIIEPQAQTQENIVIPHVEYAQDLANYIDKILYVFKNTPEEVPFIKPFVAKPRGARD